MNYFFLSLFSLLFLFVFSLFSEPVYAVAQSTTNEHTTDSTTISANQLTSTEETTANETFVPAFVQGNETIYLSLIGIACILFLVLLLFINSKRH